MVMKEKASVIRSLSEAGKMTIPTLGKTTGIVSTIIAFVSGLELFNQYNKYFVMAMIVIGVIVVSAMFCKNHTLLQKKEYSFNHASTKNHHFHIMKNNYEVNMRNLISSKDFNHTYFATGVDARLAISQSSRGGVLYSIITELTGEKLESKNSALRSELENLIEEKCREAVATEYSNNERVINSLKNNGAVPFGTIFTIKIKLDEDYLRRVYSITKSKSYKPKPEELDKTLNLVLIANSINNITDGEFDNLFAEDFDSQQATVSIFKYCKKKHYPKLMMAVIGTNGLKNSYPLVVNEILNSYMYSAKMQSESAPQDVILSIRKEDFETEISPSETIVFANRLFKFCLQNK